MAEHDFTHKGKPYRLSRADVEKALRGVDPEVIRSLAVWVNAKWYPVKQALAKTMGLASVEVNSGTAYRQLKRLGFPMWDDSMGPRPAAPDATARPEAGLRLRALELAVASVGTIGDSGPDRVIAAADAYLAWLDE